VNDTVRFLNWSLGHEQRWPVTVEVDGTPPREAMVQAPRDMRRWVTLREGPELLARFDGGEARVKFHRGSDRRAVQRLLRDAPEPILSRLAWSATGDATVEGELTLARGAMPVTLEAPPVIVVTEAHLKQLKRPRDSLAQGLTIPTPDGLILAAQTILLKGVDGAASEPWDVSLFVDSGHVLRCRMEGSAGRERLVVVEVDATPLRVSAVRFVMLPGKRAPQVVAGDASTLGSDLARLAPVDHPRLRSWLEYERLGTVREAERFELRSERPLEYGSVGDPRGESPSFPLRLVGALSDNLQGWTDDTADPRTKRLQVAVEVHALDGARASMRGNLVGFTNREGAMEMMFKPGDRRAVPPARGRILAVEDKGNAAARERRQRALERILRGGAACPELLPWLFDPSGVPRGGAAPKITARPGQRPLNESQREAVARIVAGYPLTLVQGPPGTGKTQVIAEAVLQLRNRRRRSLREGEPLDTPLRVLVSSVQNDAVANALSRLGEEGVEVYLRMSRERRADQDIGEDGRTLAAKLEARLDEDPALARQARLEQLHEEVAALTAHADALQSDTELAAALRQLVAIHTTGLLRPTMQADLDALVREAPAATTSEPAPVGTDDAAVAALRATIPMHPALSTAPATLVQMEALIEALERQGGDGATVAATRWRRAHRALRRSVQDEALDDALPELMRLADEASAALARDAEHDTTAAAPSHWRREVVAWAHRATSALAEERLAGQRSDGAVLLQWMRTLKEEPTRLARLKEHHAPVVAATCQLAAPRDDPGDNDLFDLVIVDEAARAGIDVLIPMSLGRQVVLVGDHKQLPPHIEKELADQMEQGLREDVPVGESLFRWLWERLPPTHRTALVRQYRMHETIGRVVSAVFYEDERPLEHHFSGELAAQRAPGFGLLGDKPIVWVDTRDVMRDEAARRRLNLRWPAEESNAYEADLVVELLRGADREALKRLQAETGRSEVVGVIPFYEKQVQLVKERLAALDAELFGMVRCGTVDSFQGMEFPLVVVSCVKSNAEGRIGFLHLPQRTNVAISRAQRQVVLVGDAATFERRPDSPLGKVLALLRQQPGLVVPSQEVRP
jgi:cell division protein FtsB